MAGMRDSDLLGADIQPVNAGFADQKEQTGSAQNVP